MADPAPKTRNWRAIENAHKPKGLHVLVFGEVEVSATTRSRFSQRSRSVIRKTWVST